MICTARSIAAWKWRENLGKDKYSRVRDFLVYWAWYAKLLRLNFFLVFPLKYGDMYFSLIYFDVLPGNRRQAFSEKTELMIENRV